ncbi:ATP-binding cassette domain-containing protein, partial [Kingella kingae]
MNTLLTLSQVTKQYGAQKAVNNVDLTLQAGECVGLAGHNGAGKSTMMKLILGLISPTVGSVTLLGENVSGNRAAEIRRQIGYLPETVALHPSLTGKETLDFYAKLKGTDLSHNMDLLAKVGIAQSAQKRVGAYSKG